MKRLAIVSSHPIQYNAPWFRLLAASHSVRPKVFYTWEQSQAGAVFDAGFGKKIEWDIPLLEGYEYTFVKNTAADPGVHHFRGIVNPSLNREIEEWKADAILVSGWNFHSHLSCMRYFHGKMPVLFRGDSTLLNERPGLKKQIRTLFLKWVYRHIDFALYVGTNNKLYFQRHGLREDQLVLAPHAIDNDRFSQPEEQYRKAAETWKSELGIPPGHLTVLYAGKLEDVKNPGFILRLAEKTRELPVKFVLIGNGHLEQELKQEAANYENTIFLDFQNQTNMPVAYRLGDIFILPSLSETWGLGANEAMACGCALLLSEKVGGAVDLVKEGKNGLVFKMEEWEKCVYFIKGLSENKDRLMEMKQSSRQHVKDFSFSAIINAINNSVLHSNN